MRKVVVVKDNQGTFDQNTENLINDVTRQLDDDLRKFGFGGRGLFSSMGTPSTDLHGDDLFGRVLGSSVLGGGSSNTPGTPSSTPSLLTSDPFLKDPLTLDSERPFRVNFDLRDFQVEEISVVCEGRLVIVSARHEENEEGAMKAREFNKKVRLPDNLDPEQLSSFFTDDGILTIEAVQPTTSTTKATTTQSPEATCSSPTTTGASGDTGDCQAGGRSVSFQTSDTSASNSLPLDTPVFSSDLDGTKRMNLLLELGPEYEPEDVTVRLEGRKLIVEATRMVKGEGKSSKLSVQRDFDLTEDIDSTTVEAVLKGCRGRLSVSALVEKKGKCKVVAG